MPSDPLPDFIGDKEAVTHCCEGCLDLDRRLRDAERRYRELLAAALPMVKPWLLLSAVLADHAVEDATKGKEAEDAEEK